MQMFQWACFGVVYAIASLEPVCQPGSGGMPVGVDTIRPVSGPMQKMMDKFCRDSLGGSKNDYYKPAFANIIKRLEACTDYFNFTYHPELMERQDPKAGSFTYDGREFYILIKEPGERFGTDIGAEGIMFEEVKHAEQMINGETRFELTDTGWVSFNCAQLELCTKIFVIRNLHIHKDYQPDKRSPDYSAPTELGYLNCYLGSNAARKKFLMKGETDFPVKQEGGTTTYMNYPAPYPGLIDTVQFMENDYRQVTKRLTYYVYPRLVKDSCVFEPVRGYCL